MDDTGRLGHTGQACPSCNEPVPQRARWCGRCGARLVVDHDEDAGVDAVVWEGPDEGLRSEGDGASGRRRWILAFVGVTAVVLVLVGGRVLGPTPEVITADTAFGPGDGTSVTSDRAPGRVAGTAWEVHSSQGTPLGFVDAASMVAGTAVVRTGTGLLGVHGDRAVWFVLGAGPTRFTRELPPMDVVDVVAGGELFRLDARDGTVDRRVELVEPAGAYVQVGLSSGDVTVVRSGQAIRAIDVGTGEVRWELPGYPGDLLGVTDGVMVLGNRGAFTGRRIADGQVVARWGERAIGYDRGTSSDVAVGGGRVVGLMDGRTRLEAVDVTTGETLWASEVEGSMDRLVGPGPGGDLAAVVRDGDSATLMHIDGESGRVAGEIDLSDPSVQLEVTAEGVVLAKPDEVSFRRFGSLGSPAWTVPRPDGDGPRNIASAGNRVFVDGPTGIEVIAIGDGSRTVTLPYASPRDRMSSVVVDGAIMTGQDPMAARDLQTGDVLWRSDGAVLLAAVSGTVAAFESPDHGSDEAGTLRGLDATDGSERWRASMPAAAFGPPATSSSRGRLLTAAATSVATTLELRDPADGEVLASTELDQPVQRYGIVADDRSGAVLLRDDEERTVRVAFMDLAGSDTLKVRWRTQPDGLAQELALTPDGLLVRTTASIELLDRQDGSLRWRHELDQLTRPGLVIDDGQVTVGVGVDTMVALDITSGDETWRYEHDRPIVTQATGAGDRIHVLDADSQLLAIDRSGRSTVLGQLPGGRIATDAPLVTHERIAVPTDRGLLVLRAQP